MDFATAQQLLNYITRDKNTLYVICPFNIGDFLINGGFCHALLKKKRKQSCILIERDRFANSGLNFVGVKEIQYISQTLMDIIRQYIYATREYETDNFIYGHFKMGQNGYVMNENLSFIDRYKEDVFGLPLNTEFVPPIIGTLTDYQKKQLDETYILNKERTIILAPYANSMKNLEESFWVKLVAELIKKNKDYILYTNVSNPYEKVIPGTTPIVTNFQELMYLAEKVNCFIGLRSGIFDLLALTNAKLLYVLRNIRNWHNDLKINFNHVNSRAFYIANTYERENILAFMEQNNLLSIDCLNFEDRVMGKDVSLDINSLLEKIVSSVD